MIINAIKSTDNPGERLLSIGYRYKGKPFGDWLCDWNTVPNTLRIHHRCTTIDVVCSSWKECLKFILSMKFIQHAERVQGVQEYNFLSERPRTALEILSTLK